MQLRPSFFIRRRPAAVLCCRQQLRGVRMNRIGKCMEVVPTLKQADNFSAAELTGAVGNESCQSREVFGFKSQRADRIRTVGIKAGADENQFGFRSCGRPFEHVPESFAKLVARDSESQR